MSAIFPLLPLRGCPKIPNWEKRLFTELVVFAMMSCDVVH
jgi:hypothetical protein